MINQFHETAPSKRAVQAYESELRTMQPLESGPVRINSVTQAGSFGGTVNLGVYPQQTSLITPLQS